MNMTQHKNFALLIYIGLAIVVIRPSTIISEPRYKKESAIPPLTILYSGIVNPDSDNSLLLRINSANPNEIISPCDDQRKTLTQEAGISTIEWKPGKNCKIPLITYKGKNYILPLNQQDISIEILSDISTETLKNTLAITTLINTSTKLSSLKTRKIIRNISAILEARETPFLFPMEWVKVPEKDTFLPSSPRPYRASITDGVHHGWDFYTKQGTPIRAVEEGQIVHIKRDFSWNEMNHLHDAGSELGRQENLDIYRWNTVYLKTLSGYIAIYCHMQDIPAKLKVGDFVAAGSIVGYVGDSAVPDKKYLYHLHFELGMNPFNDTKAGTYTFEDYLVWPYFGKWKTTAWVKENDNNLFR